ncbi:MAG TPA: DNA helicase UvrD, partial [Phycisphaerae bacterium]|nr:DNA helicase UvrD [Phycisphaerae bacterium]
MDYLADLNEPQRQAVQHIDGPMLVLAGAGSGKTRVITRRVAYLLSQGVRPWEILAITFTNKAAGEMAKRIEHISAVNGITACTFHSLCARLLRRYGELAGLEPNYSIYDRDDQIRVMKQALEALHLSSKEQNPSQLLSAISRAKNELQTARVFESKAENHRDKMLSMIFNKYQAILTGNNAVDFDDLLLKMAILLRDRPDVQQELSRQYRYVLVDEYQDTNHAQYLLAHSIALEHGNLCVTGDPDQ